MKSNDRLLGGIQEIEENCDSSDDYDESQYAETPKAIE